MKYETPELTALTPAINAIQSTGKFSPPNPDDAPPVGSLESSGAYEDWE